MMKGTRQKFRGKSSETRIFIKFNFSLPSAFDLLPFYL
jgi:hypothetical protein